MSDRKLKWSDRLLQENRLLFDYLLEEWGKEIAISVREQIDRAATRILNSPEHFQIFSKPKNIRRCVLSPQTSIFFKVGKDWIEILSIFDNRQNPHKLKL